MNDAVSLMLDDHFVHMSSEISESRVAVLFRECIVRDEDKLGGFSLAVQNETLWD
jgi:hypothetical protein